MTPTFVILLINWIITVVWWYIPLNDLNPQPGIEIILSIPLITLLRVFLFTYLPTQSIISIIELTNKAPIRINLRRIIPGGD